MIAVATLVYLLRMFAGYMQAHLLDLSLFKKAKLLIRQKVKIQSGVNPLFVICASLEESSIQLLANKLELEAFDQHGQSLTAGGLNSAKAKLLLLPETIFLRINGLTGAAVVYCKIENYSGSKEVDIEFRCASMMGVLQFMPGPRALNQLNLLADNSKQALENAKAPLKISSRTYKGKIKSKKLKNKASLHAVPALALSHMQTPEQMRIAAPKNYWPAAHEFAEAIQNPPVNFADPELQESSPVLDQLGMPQVASGMFASVFHLVGKEKQWALRCFNSRPNDQAEHYKEISSFIMSDDLPYTVDFAYLEKGIKLGGNWFEVLKMDWVEGQTLELHLAQIREDRHALSALQAEFRKMMIRMSSQNVAHGDLQHGNIIVNKAQIFLVDYDGFFVPALAGKLSKELGHPNYQHPGRCSQDFAAYIDNFSARLIDLSLTALIKEASLWLEFQGGEECLLFRKADLQAPQSSKLFHRLLASEDEELRQSTKSLLHCLRLAPELVPSLELGNEIF